MSLQSSLSIASLTDINDSNVNSTSNLQHKHAEVEAISNNSERLDTDRETVTAVEHPQPKFDIRKRKVNSRDYPLNSYFSGYNANFLSGIFDDIAKAQERNLKELSHSYENGTEHCCSPSALKKPRLAKTSTLTRSFKSFKNLSAMGHSQMTLSTEVTSMDSSHSPNIIEPSISTEQGGSEDSMTTKSSVIVSDNYEEAANIIDSVLNVDIIFPNIPASISKSTCSSTDNLTQTSVPDAQVSETSKIINIDGKNSNGKDVYGWFVEMDHDDTLRDRADAIADASDKARISSCDLSFSAATAPKRVVDDDELEWAKAADTVDDVLGDFF